MTGSSAARTANSGRLDGRIWLVDIGRASAPPTRMPSSRTASSTVHPRAAPATCGRAASWRRWGDRCSDNPIIPHTAGRPGHPPPDPATCHVRQQFQTRWVTVHDDTTDGMATFDANAIARRVGPSPFKRPRTACSGLARTSAEVRVHRDRRHQRVVGGGRRWVTTERSTSSASPARRVARHALSMVYRETRCTRFDNVSFSSFNGAGGRTPVTRSTRSEMRSTRCGRSATDVNYGARRPAPKAGAVRRPGRIGHTIDSGFSRMDGYQNEGDNEVTGIHVSDGDASTPACSVPRSHPWVPGSPGGCSSPQRQRHVRLIHN